jgi:hypothetical protein
VNRLRCAAMSAKSRYTARLRRDRNKQHAVLRVLLIGWTVYVYVFKQCLTFKPFTCFSYICWTVYIYVFKQCLTVKPFTCFSDMLMLDRLCLRV